MSRHPVLTFDTCGEQGTVALADVEYDTGTVTCRAWRALGSRAAAAELMPAIAELLGEARMVMAEVHALVVVHGPGSFTGIRVGLSTAKGLAYAVGTPIVAVSRLLVLEEAGHAGAAGLAVLDAGRGEFYARHAGREWLATHEEVEAAARQGVWLVAMEERAAARLAAWAPEMVSAPDAVAAVRTALPRLRAADFDDVGALDAHYLRRSDAELFARPAPAAV